MQTFVHRVDITSPEKAQPTSVIPGDGTIPTQRTAAPPKQRLRAKGLHIGTIGAPGRIRTCDTRF